MAKRSVREYKNFRQDVWDLALRMSRYLANAEVLALQKADPLINQVFVPQTFFEKNAEILYKALIRSLKRKERNPDENPIIVRTRFGAWQLVDKQ